MTSSIVGRLGRLSLALVASFCSAAAFAVDVQISGFTDNPDPAVRGGTIAYTITVQNSDADTAHNVVVSYPLPASSQFVSASDPAQPGACTFDGLSPGTVTCTYPTLLGTLASPTAGPVETITVLVKTTGSSVVTLISTVSVSTTDADTNLSNNSLSQNTTITNGADLSATMSGAPNPATGGGNVTWTVSGSNLGPNTSGTVTYTTTLPGVLTYVAAGSGGGGWTCGASGQVVTCTLAAQAVGAYPNLPIVTKVTGTGSGTITLSGNITSTVGDPDLSNNSPVASVTLNPGADLAVTQSAPSPSPAISGAAVTFVLQPSNVGPYPATAGANVSFPLPTGFTVNSATGSTGWTCSSAGAPPTVTCTFAGSLASGASGTLTIVAVAPTVGTPTVYSGITATIAPNAGGPADPNAANNTASRNLTVAPDGLDLSVTKTKSPTYVAVGANMTSNIVVNNAGPRTAAAGTVSVVDALDPTREQYVTFSGTNWTCVSAAPNVNCTYNAALGIGNASTLTITTLALTSGTITNNATASYSGTPGDYNSANNAIGASVTATAVNNSPDLQVSLAATTAGGVQTTVEADETQITYALTLTNKLIATPVNAQNVVVTLSIPGRLTTTNVAVSQVLTNTSGTSTAVFTCTGTGTGSVGNVVCTQSGGTVLSPGDVVTFTAVANRPMLDVTGINATANAVSTSQGDPLPSDNTATVPITIVPIADVELVAKLLAANPVLAGTNATYTITLKDDGPSSAAGVSLADVFTIPGGDSGFTFISATASNGGVCSGLVANTSYASGTPTETCTWAAVVTNGSTRTVTIVVRPNWQAGLAARTLANTATVSTTTAEDSVGGTGTFGNSKSLTLNINPAQVDVLINDSDLVDPIGYDPTTPANNDISYIVVETNNGPSLASSTGFSFTMTPPSGKTVTFRGDGASSGVAAANPTGTIPGSICDSVGTSVTGPATMTVTCLYAAPGLLATGTSQPRTMVFRVGTAPNVGGDTYTTLATVIVNENDTNLSNNSEGETTTVRVRADIGVVKSASINPAQLRQPFNWTVVVSNAGPGDSQRTGLTDTLPAGMAFSGAAPSWTSTGGGSGTCTVTGSSLVCAFGVLPAGQSATVTIPVRVTTYPSGGTTQNCATATTSEVDPNSANNLSVCGTVAVQVSSIAGTVFQDRDRNGANAGTPQAAATEPRISGVAVALTGTDAYGNAVSSTTTSDVNGAYSFANLSPAGASGYTVTETQPAAFVNGPASPPAPAAGGIYAAGGSAGNSTYTAVGLAGNTAGVGYDFPEVRRPSLSGFVYVDNNANGTRDAGTDGAASGATVRLLNANTLAVVATTTTDGTGAYSFTGLDPLTVYTLEEPLPSTPAGLSNGAVNPGLINGAACASGCTAQPDTPAANTDRIASIDLGAGTDGTAFNFGELPMAGISGTVYLDVNRNGTMEAAPTDGRIAGVTVTLRSGSTCAGSVLATTTSDASGNYSFGGTATGSTVTICETQPTGYAEGSVNPGVSATSSAANAITITALPSTGSAGNLFGERAGSIAGNVFLDANDDGLRAGDVGIAGVTVTLTGTDASGAPVSRTATTDATGAYRFDTVLAAGAGGYTLTEQTAQPVVGGKTTLNGKTTAGSSAGTATTVAATPSAIASIALAAGAVATENNFAEILPVSLAGVVFVDLNDNGVQNLPGDVGIAGVAIVVTGTDDTGAAVTRNVITAADGSYALADLRPGTYTVTEPTQPAATTNGRTIAGSAGGTATAPTVTPSAIAGIVLTTPGTAATAYDFAELSNTSAVSGRVWLDSDNNGLVDGTEPGIAGVTITLAGTDLGGNAVSRTTTTDASGNYAFTSLAPGTYTLTEPTQPTGTLNGRTVAGSNGGTPTAATTTPSAITGIVVGASQSATANNFGELPPASIAGHVISDSNNNGKLDAGESGIANVGLVLTGTDDLGNAVNTSATSDANGAYSFANLRPGSYTVTEPTQPPATDNGITTAGTVNGTTTGTATSPASLPSAISAIALPVGGASIGNDFAEIGNSPDVLVTKASDARFTVDNVGTYTINVRNGGELATTAAYRVSDRLPTGLTLAAVPTGTGWTCVGAIGASSFTCTSSDVMAAGASSANAITVKVLVAAAAAQNSPAINAVMVDGGGELPARAPSPAELDGFNNTPANLPACAAGITQNACRTTTIVQASASLSGTVWYDTGNARNVLDGGDQRLAGWLVEVLDASGNIVARATTAADGTYRIVDLVPGVALHVRFRDPASNVVFAYPVNGEASPGSSGASCNTAQAIASGTASSCAGTGNDPTLTVVLAAGANLPQQSLPVDPSGVVYDSGTRQPVPGAVVTLAPSGTCAGWDPATGLVASPLGGYTVNGSAVSMTVGADGFYQFLFAPAAPASCTFAITVAPPSGYTFASALIPPASGPYVPAGAPGASSAVQPQAGAPTGAVGPATTYYLTLTAGSGTANVVNNHIPLDPSAAAGLSLSKTGDKSVAEIGDSVRYTLTVLRSSGAVPRQVTIVDRLPAGFTFIAGTAVLNGVTVADPAGKPGPALTFDLGAMPSTGQLVLQYRVRVGVGAQQGTGINRAIGYGCGVPAGCTTGDGTSPLPSATATNEARFKVTVSGGVFTTDSCFAGKIFVDCNGNHIQDPEEIGIPGVRLVVSDGTTLVSDSEGKYSYCGMAPRSAVIRVDETTLPRGARLTTSSNRNLGDAGSLWLDLKNGELARADFVEGSCSAKVIDQVKARRAQGEVRSVETEKTSLPALKFDSKDKGPKARTAPSPEDLRTDPPAHPQTGGTP